MVATGACAALAYVALFRPPSSSYNSEEGTSSSSSSLLSGLAFFLLGLIQRGEDGNGLQWSAASSRVFYLTVACLCFVLFNFYVADLTATMTAGREPVSLASFQDVADKGYTLYSIGGSFLEGLFEKAEAGSPMGRVYADHLVIKDKRIQNCSMIYFSGCYYKCCPIFLTAYEKGNWSEYVQSNNSKN